MISPHDYNQAEDLQAETCSYRRRAWLVPALSFAAWVLLIAGFVLVARVVS